MKSSGTDFANLRRFFNYKHMIIVPNQPFGIGDVIFCQTLVNRIADGMQIVWPVWTQFVDQLNRAYPNIHFVDYKKAGFDHDRRDQFTSVHPIYGEYTQLPMRFADQLLNLPYNDCMKAKYMLYGMDFEDWRDCAMWVKDGENEDLLMFIKKDEWCIEGAYTLTNETFGSDGNLKSKVMVGGCCLPMEVHNQFSLFDWVKIIENATDIHTVNTSIIYLLEMLDLKAKEIHLYQRPIPGQTFDNIRYILKRHKYIFHG